jgi:hypothetical protein
MTDPDQWTELPTCPNCGMTGSAHLSRPEGRAFDFSVDAIPEGFKGIRLVKTVAGQGKTSLPSRANPMAKSPLGLSRASWTCATAPATDRPAPSSHGKGKTRMIRPAVADGP